MIYPASGSSWFPSNREQSLADAFLVIFVAELETYFEAVIERALTQFHDRFIVSGLQDCGAATTYIEKIIEQRKALAKNNNANWSKIKPFFHFIGLNEIKFPPSMWDSIEVVVRQRGDIAHQSIGIRAKSDPRIIIDSATTAIKKIMLFDRDFLHWENRSREEYDRILSLQLKFIPGIGSISTQS